MGSEISKRDVTCLGSRSSLLQASFNYERVQAGGFTWAVLPILKKIYKDDKPDLDAVMKDNPEFIDIHPNLVGFLMGLLIPMEEKGKNRDTIKGLKVVLFGPIARIGDAIFWFALLPIMAGICSLLVSQGDLLGPILFFAVYLLIFFLRVGWTHVGYPVGVRAIDKVRENSQMITRSATILGIIVIGGLIASYMHTNVVTSFAIDSTHSVALQQNFSDKAFPNILPMAYTLLVYYFLRVKKAHPVLLIGVTFVLSIVCSALGILQMERGTASGGASSLKESHLVQTLQQVENYTALSERASEYLLAMIRCKLDAVICLATGATSLLTYRYLVERIHQQQVDVSQLTFVKLDEWVDLPLTMPGTCEAFLQQHIVQPLGLRGDQLISSHSEEINKTECERITNLIVRKGGLDLCVLGLGKSGYLGLNELGESLQLACHISQLDARTQQHEMLKTADRPVTRGITLDLKDIFNAREVLLLMTGEGKQDMTERFLTAKAPTAIPASFLWLHNYFTYMIDEVCRR